MAKQNINSKQGFTIIEVVLVLAIAGLILLMVFVALPSLQRSQRDTQRRQDMARLITAVQNYQANNGNQSPSAFDSNFVSNYLTVDGDTFNDPSTGSQYAFSSILACTSNNCGYIPKEASGNNPKMISGTIYVNTNAKCSGETPEYAAGNNRMTFRIALEGAGVYCVDI